MNDDFDVPDTGSSACTSAMSWTARTRSSSAAFASASPG